MTQWVTFTAIVTLLTAAMVGLSVLTQRSITPIDADSAADSIRDSERGEPPGDRGRSGTATDRDADASPRAGASRPTEPDPWETDSNRERPGRDGGRQPRPPDPAPNGSRGAPGVESHSPTPGAGRVVASVDGQPVTARGLLANVTVTQGLFLGLVLGALAFANVPIGVLGVEVSRAALGSGLALGLGAGLGLYGASEVGGELGRRFGVDHDEWLRESLAPSSLVGWLVLFVGVLPLIALFEELLFRGVLIGALGAGFGLSPWLLAVASSLLFAVGHGIQGTAGIVVTGVVGFVLAAIFVVTGSLLTVVVAHYVLNACEFAVHEGFDSRPLGSDRG